MLAFTSRIVSGAAIAGALAVACTVFLTISSDSAMALCRYGSPNCVKPNPGPKLPKVNTTRLPDSNWVDPDCKHYGNCRSPNSALRRPPGGGPKAQPVVSRSPSGGRMSRR